MLMMDGSDIDLSRRHISRTVNPPQSGLMGEVTGLIKQKVAIKGKKLRTQITGKFNNISSAYENK
jgi:hypothetical protein